jgi:hypothetical protein
VNCELQGWNVASDKSAKMPNACAEITSSGNVRGLICYTLRCFIRQSFENASYTGRMSSKPAFLHEGAKLG